MHMYVLSMSTKKILCDTRMVFGMKREYFKTGKDISFIATSCYTNLTTLY